LPDTACSTKEEIQVIRDHYGENWLQVITAKNEDMQASSASSREHDKTEDDIYLNESHANLSGSSRNRSNFSIFVNINLEQNKRSFSICVTPDIKWTIPGSR
jgi:hypothetical protein